MINQNGILSYLKTTLQTHVSHLDMIREQGTGIGIGYCFLDHLSFLLKEYHFHNIEDDQKMENNEDGWVRLSDQTLCTSA